MSSQLCKFRILFFPDVFRLFDRKLRFIDLSAKNTYFNSIFYQGHVILGDRNNFDENFFAQSHCFYLVYNSRCVTQGVRSAPVKILLHAGLTPCLSFLLSLNHALLVSSSLSFFGSVSPLERNPSFSKIPIYA